MKTKKITQLLTLAFCAIAFAFVTSCEGPQGPAGANGTNGTDGAAGSDGTDGVDGNVTCLSCHNTETKEAIASEFAYSQHSSGAIAVDYAGSRSSCAQCHSHEGFIEFARTGDVANNISNPSAWECSTCHAIHTDFAADDYAFRDGDAVTLMADGTTVLDEANNNTCINCHQSRKNATAYDVHTVATKDTVYIKDAKDILFYNDPANVDYGPTGGVLSLVVDLVNPVTGVLYDSLTVEFDIPTTNVFISSTHAGPHHGPQANVWYGTGSAAVATGTPYTPHADGCVKCHMGPESGHSFWPEEGNCTECHTSKKTEMDAIAARILAVGEKLELIHAVHATRDFSGTVLEWHPIYASITRAQFNAFWDFMIVLEDRSNSAHNPTYVKALLTDMEAALP